MFSFYKYILEGVNMKFNGLLNNIKGGLEKHNSSILLGLGLGGMLVSTVSAVTTTVKTTRMIDDLSKDVELSKKRIIKETWRYYIPTVIGYTASAACIIGSVRNGNKKIAALTTAYNLSERAITEYRSKVVEVLGEEKESELRGSVNDKLSNTYGNSVVVMPTDGLVMCRDSLSGRYFRSTTNDIATVENKLNRILNSENYVSLNTYYEYLGLDELEMGEKLGWNVSEGLLDVGFGAEITSNGQPCVVIEHRNKPIENYIYV